MKYLEKRTKTPEAPARREFTVPKNNRILRAVLAAGLTFGPPAGYAAYKLFAEQSATIAQLQKDVATSQQQANQQSTEQLRLSRIIAGFNQIDPLVVSGVNLKQPSQLPGYGEQVGAANERALEDSAVKIVSRPKGSDSTWHETCSGNKITLNGTTYVSWASHCDVAAWNAVPSSEKSVSKPIDVEPYSKFEYAVALPGNVVSGQTDDQQILAYVTSNAEDRNTTDQALLSVSTTSGPVLDSANGQPAFNAIPALNGEQLAYNAPTPGQEIVSEGSPAANYDSPVVGTGTYLGRIFTEAGNGTNQYIDLVGITGIVAEADDSCDYGESGSTIEFANGQISGALSIRSSNPYNEYGQGDTPYTNSPAAESFILGYESQTGIDMSGFDVVCEYVAPNPTIDAELQNALGAKVPVPTTYGN